MKWLELHIDTARAGLEPVSELLREQGVEGLVIDDEADFKDRKQPPVLGLCGR